MDHDYRKVFLENDAHPVMTTYKQQAIECARSPVEMFCEQFYTTAKYNGLCINHFNELIVPTTDNGPIDNPFKHHGQPIQIYAGYKYSATVFHELYTEWHRENCPYHKSGPANRNTFGRELTENDIVIDTANQPELRNSTNKIVKIRTGEGYYYIVNLSGAETIVSNPEQANHINRIVQLYHDLLKHNDIKNKEAKLNDVISSMEETLRQMDDCPTAFQRCDVDLVNQQYNQLIAN